jgi:regulator of protease activity HflC (stomatin/prohibitin superfamily)
MSIVSVVPIGVVIVLIALLFSAVRIAREYERGVVFRLGRLLRAKVLAATPNSCVPSSSPRRSRAEIGPAPLAARQ